MRVNWMSEDDFLDYVRTEAAKRAIDSPVFVLFPCESKHAQAAYRAVTGEQLVPPKRLRGKGLAPDRILSTPEACEVLSTCCGKGGLAAASVLRQDLGQDWAMLILTPLKIVLILRRGREALESYEVRYGNSTIKSCIEQDHGDAESPSVVEYCEARLEAPGGQRLEKPVFLVLRPGSAPAQAIVGDIQERETLDAGAELCSELEVVGYDEVGEVSVALLSAGVAADLLRRHADLGGAAAAELVGDWLWNQDFWVVEMGETTIDAKAFKNGDWLWESELRYDQVPRNFRTPTRLYTGEGPTAIPILLKSGKVLVAHGPSGEVATAAGLLAMLVANRRIVSVLEGKRVSRRLTDEQLSIYLQACCIESPKVVAEAIMALRKLKGRQDRQLTRVLWGSKELRKLAQQVKVELTGE